MTQDPAALEQTALSGSEAISSSAQRERFTAFTLPFPQKGVAPKDKGSNEAHGVGLSRTHASGRLLTEIPALSKHSLLTKLAF